MKTTRSMVIFFACVGAFLITSGTILNADSTKGDQNKKPKVIVVQHTSINPDPPKPIIVHPVIPPRPPDPIHDPNPFIVKDIQMGSREVIIDGQIFFYYNGTYYTPSTRPEGGYERVPPPPMPMYYNNNKINNTVNTPSNPPRNQPDSVKPRNPDIGYEKMVKPPVPDRAQGALIPRRNQDQELYDTIIEAPENSEADNLDTLPLKYETFEYSSNSYHLIYRFDGKYYRFDPARKKYSHILPPAGMIVTTLPEGYETVSMQHFYFKGVFYEAWVRNGVTVYRIIR